MARTHKIGIVGTGFIARGLTRLLINHHPDLEVVSALTRRDPNSCSDFPLTEVLTQSVNELIDKAELVIECSGDVIHATEIIDKVLQAGLPCVTMNSEFHVTAGSYFIDKGYLTEAEGNQPGCLAALNAEIKQMGFKPLVYGNMKRFLNPQPEREDMLYWAEKHGFTLPQTTSFTDGTQLQIQQAFIANGMGATITQAGMEGLETDDHESGARALGEMASELGKPIADYILSDKQPPGVFITATHDASEHIPLRNIKMGDGPYYVLMRNHHLCAYEMIKTIRRVLEGADPLLTNSRNPVISVASIAKTSLKPGTTIRRGIGGFEVRGETIKVSDNRAHVPIGLLYNATVTRQIEAGQLITYDDVEIPDSLASRIARDLFS